MKLRNVDKFHESKKPGIPKLFLTTKYAYTHVMHSTCNTLRVSAIHSQIVIKEYNNCSLDLAVF